MVSKISLMPVSFFKKVSICIIIFWSLIKLSEMNDDPVNINPFNFTFL